MTTPSHGEDISAYTEPKHVTFTGGEGFIPLGATIHSPFIIEEWRADLYMRAAEEHLPDDITPEEAHDLEIGCRWAASRATRYEVSQEDSLLDPREQRLLGLIGQEQFLAINHAVPPSELIDYMLTGGTDKLVRPRLESITVAVIKGDMEWEERFAEAGVPKPDELVAEYDQRHKEHIERMEKVFGKRKTPANSTGKNALARLIAKVTGRD